MIWTLESASIDGVKGELAGNVTRVQAFGIQGRLERTS
jgi:hypothetical protein